MTQAATTAAELYESVLVPAIYNTWANYIVDLAKPRPGDRALDIGCGTGIVTRGLSEKLGASGDIIGLDNDCEMLSVARTACRGRRGTPITWEEGSAMSLPFNDEAFEIITCQQALPYIRDRATVVREMYRVLSFGGRIAMLVWREIEHSPGFAILAAALERYAGADAAAVIRSAFTLGNQEELHSLLLLARFRSINIEAASGTAHFDSIETFVKSQLMNPALTPYLTNMPAPSRVEMFGVLTNALKPHVNQYGLVFPMGAYLISAKK
jgi:ubiquinone/menaquinone biosynthesis C-methylase UbiE